MMRWLTSMRGLSVAVCLLLLLGLCLVLFQLPAWRVDLTQERLYTLSEGSRSLVRDLNKPLTLTLYFSRSLADNLPQLGDYAQRIEDMLHEYQALNPDLISVKVVDPKPFSEEEDEVTVAGLQGAPVTLGGDSLYLGLIAASDGGEGSPAQEVIAFFSPERERFLEYDLSQVIHRLSQPQQIVVGVISGVQMFGGFDFATQRPTAPWAVVSQLQEVADVRELYEPLARIEENVNVLMVVHPRDLDDTTLYAIDQYALNGGRVLLFVDPHAEINSRAAGQANSSNAEKLLQAWGVEYDPEALVGDRKWGLRIATDPRSAPMPHVGIIGLPTDAMDKNSIITAELESLNVASAGALRQRDGDTAVRFQSLLHTSSDAMLIDSQQYLAARDHGDLLANFQSADQAYVLAAQVSGPVHSAFDEAPQPEQEAEDAPPVLPHQSEGELNAVIVADVDMLSDRLWVQVSNLFGEQVLLPWANNGDFVVNAVENLGGSQALISLRSRGQYSRPFTLVNSLRAEAAEEFKQQEQVLLQRLDQLETSIASLKPSVEANGELVLSDDQRAEIEAFEAQRLETRKQLRQVQHQLNESIDVLEGRLRWLNMGLVPALLLLLMAIVMIHRRRLAAR